MKKYINPTLEISTFGAEDIIMASGDITNAKAGTMDSLSGYTFNGNKVSNDLVANCATFTLYD